MSDLKTFKTLVDDIWEMVFGTKRTSETECKATVCCEGDCHTDIKPMSSFNEAFGVKPKRARTKGRYKADDKSTKDVNEAWVGGKAPKKKKRKK